MLNPQRPEQSIRSSCDRCRSSKLKCVPTSDSDHSAPCQRCVRAKATCVFGQRARNKRGPRRPRRSMSPVSEEWRREGSSDDTPGSLSSSSSIRVCASIETQRSPDEDQSLTEAVMMPTPNMASALEAPWTPNSMVAVSNSNTDMTPWREASWTSASCPMVESLGNIWPESSISASGGSFMREFQMPQGQMTPSSINQSEQLDFGDMIMQTLDGSNYAGQGTSPPPTRRGGCSQLELSGLLGEMQKYLHMLKTYQISAHRLPADALNDYPIGEALYLLRRFCELQDRVRESGHSPTWPQSAAIDPDMVAALVIVTCYITMMRILDTLFGHLEQYLARMSAESAPRGRKSVVEHSRGLRLGELTPVNDVCVRTREAVGTLLEALRGMDLAIGTPQEKPWGGDEMDDVADSAVDEDGLTVSLLREENIGSKIDEERKRLCAKISEVERHLDRLLNSSTDV